MHLFLDSSALAKRYIEEPGSEVVLHYCQEASDIIVSVLCIPEIISAFNRLKKDKHLTSKQYRSLKTSLIQDIEQAAIIDLTPDVIQTSIACLEKTTIKTLDALHIASAIAVGCDLFLTADLRQSKAATAMKLAVKLVAS
jgi:uncharacterized protein